MYVDDTMKPEITISNKTIPHEEMYDDSDVTCLDDVKGMFDAVTITGNNVNSSQPGKYTLTYLCIDDSSNAVTGMRTVALRRTNC